VDDDISVALADAARTIGRRSTQEDTLQTIADTAMGSIPGFNHVGVSTIDKRGRITTRAATSPLVRELDALQYELREGPCYDSLQDAVIVSAPHIAHDQRWPRYVPAAVKAGLRSQLAVKLFLDDEGTVGGLNLYSTSQAEIDPGAAMAADLFASQAVVALEKTRELDELHHALTSREQIGQAIGLVMAQYHLSSQAAFNFLARTSSQSNIKLRDIAERVIADYNERLKDQ
jgi:hypothetical protein